MKRLQTIAAAFAFAGAAFAGDALREGFENPPKPARSQTWWHWMNGNVTKEGITADLEAMAKAGIGGAYIFDVPCGIPEGKVRFASDGWYDMLAHANAEAKRLGLDLSIANCGGWSSSGGPWIRPEDSMKHVVCSESTVRGGARLKELPPQPANTHGFYRDIAILAFPSPAAEKLDPKRFGMATTFKPGDATAVFRFKKPFPLSGVSLNVEARSGYLCGTVKIDVSEDGVNYRTATQGFEIYPRRFNFRDDKIFVPVSSGDPVTVKSFKIAVDLSVSTGIPGKVWEGAKSVRTANAKGLKSPAQRVLAVRPEARGRIPELNAKIFAYRTKIHGYGYCAAKGLSVDPAKIVDLTGKKGEWLAPAGTDWTVVRFGYASNGEGPHPATAGAKGLEVDKLSDEALGRHFAGYVDKVLERIGSSAGDGGIKGVLVDSYEVGGQNWTHGFGETFEKRRGYSLLKFLPALTGRPVGSREDTEKFLGDFRRTIAELFAENYAAAFHRRANERGLAFTLEGYGGQPCADLAYARHCDIPAGEFWAGSASAPTMEGRVGKTLNCRFPGFVSHVWGQRVCAAEAFTSLSERWDRAPYDYKAQGDRAYCQGINRIVYHTWAHQPWTNPANYPGMTMGFIGSNFGRTLTWWDDGAPALMKYQARCQWMLQEGTAAADILVFAGDSPASFGLGLTRWHDYDLVGENAFGIGRQWDVCDGEALAASKAEKGEVTVPGGAKYKAVAVLPGIEISPASQAALDAFAANGAIVAPAGDVHKKLSAAGIGPDVVCLTKECSRDFRWIRRRAPDGSDVYFVALANEKPASFELSFRVEGRVPEIWDPDTGLVSKPVSWRSQKGRTVVRFDFAPAGSAFAVFRPAPSVGLKDPVPFAAKRTLEIEGPWQVEFVDGRGAPSGKVEFDALVAWNVHPEDGIRHYSGTAVYSKRVSGFRSAPGERVFVDLGEVKNIASVKVDGRLLPVLWKPPYRLEITEALGENKNGADGFDLEVRVTNLWPNRLIGDDALESDAKYNPTTKRWKGGGLKTIPQRVFEGRPSPCGRHTFATWRHWKKDEKLLPSGMIGPVKIEIGE